MMKQSIRKHSLFLVLLLFALMLSGCSAGSSSVRLNGSADSEKSDAYIREEVGSNEWMSEDCAVDGGDSSLSIGAVDPSRKMIYQVSYRIQTLDFDASLSAIDALAAEFGGYTESSEIFGKSIQSSRSQLRSASLVLRIPADQLNSFFGRVSSIGTITGESLSSQDVTLQYVDIDARLKTLHQQEERILALLAEASDLQAVLEIEQTLSDIRYQIESYTSRLKQLDSQIAYSTVSISLSEVAVLTEPKAEPQTFGERLADTFRSSTLRLRDGFRTFAIWFLGNILEILFWLLLIALVVLAVLLLHRHRTRRRQSRQNPPEKKPLP